MKQFLFMISLLSVLCVSLFHIFSGFSFSNTVEASPLPVQEQITVKQGDTLWRIADRYNERYEVSIWEMVDQIKQVNHLERPVVYPGETLYIVNEN